MLKVFVSSTSEDLKPYRRAAKDVVIDLGYYPVMMEHFGTDGSAGIVEACTQRVGEADLVLGILGWRQGWVPSSDVGGDGKRSMTQIEIETAKALGKPIVALFARDDWPRNLSDHEPAARAQIEALRGGLDRLAVSFGWEAIEVGATEELPQFRAKVRQELLRHMARHSPSMPPPVPSYPSDEIRALSEALEEALEREETIVSEGGDPTVVRQEMLDLRRRIREGGNVKAGDILSGRFKLIELLGDGGFATVWKAFDRGDRKNVAVKVLHPQYAKDSSRLQRFHRGARQMAELSLRHPGIVRVLEKRLEDIGHHYFVMEYVQGGDLGRAILEHRLPAEDIVPLILRVAGALQFAHQEGLIHRDVKPANILLDDSGLPKLTDFDLVRADKTTGGTRAGAMMGTFLYTAPECMGAPQEAGPAADVYSLTMTAMFCFHGNELPYEVLRNSEAFLDRLSCPTGIRAALRKGAAWELSDRYTTITEFAEAIEQGLSAPVEVETAHPKSTVRQAGAPNPPLLPYLEKEIATLPEADRSAAVNEAIERALPLDTNDLKTLGIAAWALDYFPGRSERTTDRGTAAALRNRAFASLREHRPPPPMPAWAVIPGGTFLMGSAPGVGSGDERPTHHVAISTFQLGIYTVTKGEYARFLGELVPQAASLPATRVDWYTAYAYAAWLGGRLPTEAEWEYAARGGMSHAYSDRNGRPTKLHKVGWFLRNSDGEVHPVGRLEPNPWGLFDMIGNAREWVADWYRPYSTEPKVNPWGPPSGEKRVLRGGGARSVSSRARRACRGIGIPGTGDELQGFRVALALVEFFDP